MEMRPYFVAILMVSMIYAIGCAGIPQDNRIETQISREEVIRIANRTAEYEGINLQEYNMTGCHFEYIRQDHTWSVFYRHKPPEYPGGHFAVYVDDHTMKATYSPGY